MTASNSFNSFSFISVVILLLYSIIDPGSGLEREPRTAYQALFKKDAGNEKVDYAARADTARDSAYHEPVAPVAPTVPVYAAPSYTGGKPGLPKLNLGDFNIDELLDPSNEAMHVMTSLVLGVFNLIAYIAMDSRVASVTQDQNNICNTVRGLGNLNLAAANTAGASITLNSASINTIVAGINNLATPVC